MDHVQRADDRTFQWHELHEGRGSFTVRRYFEGKYALPIDFETWSVPVGGSEGSHRHGADDPDGFTAMTECYVVIDGRARFTLGGEVLELGPGDAVMVDPETERGFENTGDRPLILAVLYQMPADTPGSEQAGKPGGMVR